MEKWTTRLTKAALDDLCNIGDYIANDLNDTNGATKVIESIYKAIEQLENMPLRCPTYPDSPKYRYTVAGSYVVIFQPHSDEHTVVILRVYHQHQALSFL